MFRPTKTIWPVLARTVTRNIKPRLSIPHIHPRFTAYKNSIALRPLSTLPQSSTTTTTTPTTADTGVDQINEDFNNVETDLGETFQEREDLWKAYTDRIEHKDPGLTAVDFLNIARVIFYNKNLDSKEIISRLQSILRDIHERRSNDPDMSVIFVRTCNMLMKAFNAMGDIKSTRSVFEGLVRTNQEITDASVSTVLFGLSRHGTKSDIYEFVKSLQDRDLFVEKAFTYHRIILALKRLGDLRGCQYFFGMLRDKGLQPNEKCYAIMIEVYKQSKQPQMVLEMYKEMKSRNIVPSAETYTSLLAEITKHSKNKQLAQQIFDEAMASGNQFNIGIYLIMGYDPMEALLEMKKAGTEYQLRDFNHCLRHYVTNNEFDKALEVFNMLNKNGIETDQYSYTILIDALSKDKETSLDTILELYEGMKMQGIQPDTVLYTTLITACGRAHDLDTALDLLEEMQTFNAAPNAYTFNALLSVMGKRNNLTMSDLDRASELWSRMTSMNITPDTRTFNSYIAIICRLVRPAQPQLDMNDVQSESLWENQDQDNEYKVPRTVRELLRMYRFMKKYNNSRIQPDFLTYSMVINALCSAGQLRSAMQVYDDAKLSRVKLHVATYNEIMSFLQSNGKFSESINVWHDMQSQKVLPDTKTYEIVLEGCEQLGLPRTIEKIRDRQKKDFNRLKYFNK